MRRSIQALVLVSLLAACAGAEGGSVSPDESERASPSLVSSESPGASATASQTPESEEPGQGEPLTGTFGADAVEGGCAYLRAANDTRYEVLYPDGWAVVMSPLRLVDPDGNVRARAGDLVTVRGAATTDMASICQIGPIFQATEVVAP